MSGSGSISLGDGDDVLTLQDGAVLNTVIDAGGQASSDTVVLDSVSALTFDGANVAGFEELVKQNTGIATMTGAQSFSAGTTLEGGTLDVDGTLETPTVALADGTALNIDGIVQAGGATQAVVSGSTGANTVVVTAGGNLLATGDLGDGNDVLDLAGTLDTGGGTFSLGAGDDTFVVHNTTEVIGTLDAGDGNDLLNVNVDSGNLVPLGSTTGFESLGKSGLGALQINGASDFLDVQVQAGLLDVSAGGSIQAQTATVSAGATLNVDGTLQFTSGADTFTVGGNITGAGTINLLDGDDQLTLLDAADLSGLATSLEGGAGNDTLTANIATTATLGGATGFETLVKEGAGSLHIDGPAGSMFDTVLVHEGVLDVGVDAVVDPQTTAVSSGATLAIDGTYNGTSGADTFTLSGTLAGSGNIDLLDGDDILTINTGATLALSGTFDAATASADRFVLAGTDTDTFDANLIGTVFLNFDEFRKEGAGTWRLIGAAERDWTVAEGTLIGDASSFGGDIANAGTVIFDQATDGAFDGVLSGNGTTIKQSSGRLLMTAENTFTGEMQVAAGILEVDGTLPGTMTIASGAALTGTGTVGSVTTTSGAFVAPGNAAHPFGTLTIGGDYNGGATIAINAELGEEPHERPPRDPRQHQAAARRSQSFARAVTARRRRATALRSSRWTARARPTASVSASRWSPAPTSICSIRAAPRTPTTGICARSSSTRRRRRTIRRRRCPRSGRASWATRSAISRISNMASLRLAACARESAIRGACPRRRLAGKAPHGCVRTRTSSMSLASASRRRTCR